MASGVLPGMEEALGGDSTVEGVVVRVRVSRGDFRVMEVEVERKGRKIVETWVGETLPVAAGQQVRGIGHHEKHRDHGQQFRVSAVIPMVPTSRAARIEYLGGGVIDGIGPALAEKIVDHFGDAVLDVLDLSPERVTEVPGIGPDRGEKIAKGWRVAQATARMMIFMQEHGASPQLATRIVRFYLDRNEDPHQVVSTDPYRLAVDIPRVGFITADQIARSVGIGHDSDARAQAAALHVMGEVGRDGHTYGDLDDLCSRIASLTQRNEAGARAKIRAAIEVLNPSKLRIEPYDGEPEQTLFGAQVAARAAVFLPATYEAEWVVAQRLVTLNRSLGRGRADSADVMTTYAEEAIADWASETGGTLAEEQRAAVLAAATKAVVVITGGPGTGKSLTAGLILDTFRRAAMRVSLCAPTGRAAKRLSEATSEDAQTIHRMLEMKPDGPARYGSDEPLECDVVLADECSMVDLRLARSLLEAVPDGARLILVGDRDQLPSVQPGAVLRDIIASGVVDVVELKHIFRQGPGSTITRAAAEINRGVVPKGDTGVGGEFFVIPRYGQEAAAETIEHLVAERIPDRFGIQPDQIGVLIPQHKGAAGTIELNRRLQDTLNPHGLELFRAGRRFRKGDRVMQMANDYDRRIFNGELGAIVDVDQASAELTVDFGGQTHRLGDDEIEDLSLAYASTVHRAQGGQFPAVVIYMGRESEHMLTRALVYTAVTRAQKLCVLVAGEGVIASAIRETRKDKRRTRLAARLKEWA